MRHLGYTILAILGACGGSDGVQADGPGGVPDARPGAGVHDAPSGSLADGPVGCTQGQVVWVDDGLPRCAIAAIARFDMGATDALDITAADISGIALTIIVGGSHPFVVPQTVTCEQPTATSLVELTYSQEGVVLGTPASCTVMVLDVGAVGGANARGTFSAVLNATGGGTRTLANGSFDVPRTQ